MSALVEFLLFIVFGGTMVALGVASQAPNLSAKKIFALSLLILRGAPLLFMLLAVFLGINL